jgi:hypothetical protein
MPPREDQTESKFIYGDATGLTIYPPEEDEAA